MNLTANDLFLRLGKTRVLDGVDLEAESGQVLTLVGPNGAGKSTFLRTAAGLVRPEHGHIQIDGDDIHRLSSRERARRIGLVPQEHRPRYPFTVEEVVRMGRYAHRGPFGAPRREDRDRIEQALQSTRLGSLVTRSVTTLSGGERQRVLIARVLAQDPDVYLFDEPTANLDLAQAHHTDRLLRRLAGQGKLVIVVMHDLEQASRIGDRMLMLSGGRVVTTGPTRDVLTPEAIHRAYGVHAEVQWGPQRDDGARVRVQARAES